MPATAEPPVRDLQTHVQKSVLDLQRQVWKARGQAKQKWLQQALATPVTGRREAEERASWIERARQLVKSGQEEIKYQSALLDAYAEHLSVLELTLMAAIEAKNDGAESNQTQHRTDGVEPPTPETGTGRRRSDLPATAAR
jgi:hypothetical protein